ncbi:MAG: hypothetical protein V1717_04010 [Candidatus Micrarchaeota archaeon]
MAKRDSMPAIGAWAFLGGLVIAVLAGFFTTADATIVLVLGVLGLLVGLLNIADKEAQHFLVAGIAFLISAASLGSLGVQILGASGGAQIAAVFNNVAVFVAPAVAIVALKAVYDISKE